MSTVNRVSYGAGGRYSRVAAAGWLYLAGARYTTPGQVAEGM